MVKLIREVVLERRQQKRSELPFEPVDTSKRSVFQQVQEKTLGQVLGVFRGVPASAGGHVEGVPINAAQLSKGGLPPWRLALHGAHDDRPARGVKACRAFHRQTKLAFHKNLRVSAT